MPRRMTDFGLGTRSQYDYQFTGYQGGNPFTMLANVFNSGTQAERGATLQARHALLMGTIGNTLELQKHQGLSDIQFSDYQRRGEHGTQSIRDQQHYNEEHFGHRGIVVTGLDKSGSPTQAPTVSLSLQQKSAHDWNEKYGKFPQQAGGPNPYTSGPIIGAPTSGPTSGSHAGGSSTGTSAGGMPTPPSRVLHPGQFDPDLLNAGNASTSAPMGDNRFDELGKTTPKHRSTIGRMQDIANENPDPNAPSNASNPRRAKRSANPADTLTNRSDMPEAEQTDPTIEPPAQKSSRFEDGNPTSGGNGTADLSEEHTDTATSTVGTGKSKKGGRGKVTTVRAEKTEGE